MFNNTIINTKRDARISMKKGEREEGRGEGEMTKDPLLINIFIYNTRLIFMRIEIRSVFFYSGIH